jgi:hypothetical protein
MKAGVLGLALVKAGLRKGGAVNCLTKDGLNTDLSGGRGKLCCRKGLPFLGALVRAKWFGPPKETKGGAAEFWEAVGSAFLSVSTVLWRGCDRRPVAWSEEGGFMDVFVDIRGGFGGCCANWKKGLDLSTWAF